MSNDSELVKHVEFLNEAARYFENRPTGGEDRAHWANVYNAENCRKIASTISRYEEALKDVTASLVAAHSLLSRGGKKAAASDKMFIQMLADYQASIDRARQALNPGASDD